MLNLVLSGGPASGKSTSLSKIESELIEKLGMKVLIVPETATELIENGIAPGKNISMDEFQDICLTKQLEKEKMYKDVVSKYFDEDNVVVLYDRSIIDQLAYISRDKFDTLLEKHNLNMANILNRYDVILHLETSAKGTDCYTTENNIARRETAEEAIAADDKTLAANMLHPHVRVIDNSTNFEQKIQRVLKEIFDIIEAVNPSEIERKFLIKRPSDEFLNALEYSSKSDIIQTYLMAADKNTERRVRQRGTDSDGYSFYYTEKTPVTPLVRIEKEKKISMRQYVSYLTEADTSLHQVRKTRYCFIYEKQYFELDIYPYSDEYAIVEIELSSPTESVKLPEFLEIVKEVTDDVEFKNHSIAKSLSLPYKKYMKEDWIYETGREESEILGSGSNYSHIYKTKDFEMALKEFKDGYRNYLVRKRRIDGIQEVEFYDVQDKCWIK